MGFGQFYDTLLLTSSTLPTGTPVELEVELDLAWTLLAGCPLNQGVVYAGLDVVNGGTVAFVQDTSCSGDINMPTGILHATIGEEVPITVYLNASVGAQPGTATADVGHTLGFFITPLGDFTYTTTSGAYYLRDALVPEPSLVFLFAAGVFVACWKRRA
jgi:hypothetical protein